MENGKWKTENEKKNIFPLSVFHFPYYFFMNIQEYNSAAWDSEVEKQIEWSIPVSARGNREGAGRRLGNYSYADKKRSARMVWRCSRKRCFVSRFGRRTAGSDFGGGGRKGNCRLTIRRNSLSRINLSPKGKIWKFVWKKATRRICRVLRTRALI